MSGFSPEVVVALVIGIPSLLIAVAGLVVMIMTYQDTRRSRSPLSYFPLMPTWRSSSRERECWV
jgi:Tfp pilus assembly protein PilV